MATLEELNISARLVGEIALSSRQGKVDQVVVCKNGADVRQLTLKRASDIQNARVFAYGGKPWTVVGHKIYAPPDTKLVPEVFVVLPENSQCGVILLDEVLAELSVLTAANDPGKPPSARTPTSARIQAPARTSAPDANGRSRSTTRRFCRDWHRQR